MEPYSRRTLDRRKQYLITDCRTTSCRKCFWNLCFKVEESGQSHWNKSRHGRRNCEMHIYTAQYYHRLPVDLSMTPYRCRPHERPGSSGQTSLVAATSQSVRFARSNATRCDAGQPRLHTCVRPPKWVGGKRVWTLVAGTQDIALWCPFHERVHSLHFFEQHLNGLLIIPKAFISTKYIIILKLNTLILNLKPVQLCGNSGLQPIQNLWFSSLISFAVHKKHNYLFKRQSKR
jgi:hypothetical protein